MGHQPATEDPGSRRETRRPVETTAGTVGSGNGRPVTHLKQNIGQCPSGKRTSVRCCVPGAGTRRGGELLTGADCPYLDLDLVVADQLHADISSLAHADVNTSSNDGAPGAAVATAVAELVANIRGMAETEARAVESSLCEAPAMANPPEAAPTRKARNPKRRRRNRRRRRRQQQAGGDGEATAFPSHGNRLDAPLVDERSDVRVTSCGLPVCDIGGEQKTVLLGDSIVREQKVEFAQRCAFKRMVVCGPGKGVD